MKFKLGKKRSCEDQGDKKMVKQGRKKIKGKSDKVISLCCSARTGAQMLHTEPSSFLCLEAERCNGKLGSREVN
jgi:hypothetical protein